MCYGCENIKAVSSFRDHFVDYEFDRILQFNYKFESLDFLLIPKKCEFYNGIVINFCPWCGRRLNENRI